MTFFEHISKLKLLDVIIRTGDTGPAEKIAKDLGISRSTLFTYFCELKSLGAIINYNEVAKSYYYEKLFKLIF